MAYNSVSPQSSTSNADFSKDCRVAAEIEFAQLARVWRYSILTGERMLREIAFRDMMAVPIFSIDALRQKIDAMQCEDPRREMLIDRDITTREIIAVDTARVASGLQSC